MVKKRLNDLIREEANKSLDTEDQAVSQVPEELLEPEADLPMAVDFTARRTSPTKADLEIIVKELKAALQASETENSSLQQQIATSQSDLQDQKTLVEKLKVELEQTKQVILKLSESNSQPSKVASTASQTQPNSQPSKLASTGSQTQPNSQSFKVASTGSQLQSNSQSSKIATTGSQQNQIARSKNLVMAKSPDYSFQADTSSDFSDADIGWFD